MTAIADTQGPVGDNGIDLWCKGRGVSVKQGGAGSVPGKTGSRSQAGGDRGIPPLRLRSGQPLAPKSATLGMGHPRTRTPRQEPFGFPLGFARGRPFSQSARKRMGHVAVTDVCPDKKGRAEIPKVGMAAGTRAKKGKGAPESEVRLGES